MDFSHLFLSSGKIWSQVQQYFLNHVLTWAIAAQLAAGGFVFLLAHMAAEAIHSWIGRLMEQSGLNEPSHEYEQRKYEVFLKTIGPFLSVLFLGIALAVAQRFNWPEEGLKVLLILTLAVFLFRFLTIIDNESSLGGNSHRGNLVLGRPDLSISMDPIDNLLDRWLSQSVKCMFLC